MMQSVFFLWINEEKMTAFLLKKKDSKGKQYAQQGTTKKTDNALPKICRFELSAWPSSTWRIALLLPKILNTQKYV